MYVPVLSLGADIVETVIVSANIVPVTLSPSFIVTTVESLELIVFVSIVDAVNGPDTRIPSFTKISELSDDEIALIIGVVVPVTVNTSPLTAVVIFVAPAILNVSPNTNDVPLLSSPTNFSATSVFCA